MKLAEALAERSNCQVKIDEIKRRLIRSARVQEGEQPAEDTTELLAESERVFARLLELVSAINRTNSKTAFDTVLTISDAIAERDVVGKRRDFLAGIAEAGSTRQDRYSKSEVRFVATVSVGKLHIAGPDGHLRHPQHQSDRLHRYLQHAGVRRRLDQCRANAWDRPEECL
ncbi:MAG: DIP1984 family protein [Terracidiphilus sp.]